MALTLRQKLLHAIHQFNLCTRNDCLIVGVSGGADSVALLDLLATLPDFPLKLVVSHLNHQLRDKESDADEQFVLSLAARHHLPCEVQSIDIRQLARQQHLTIEEAGRMARYTFFEELRRRHQAVAVAVGHHADDQAETFLIRLLRGAGSTGLAAMSPINQNRIIRPLLEITRQELRNYLSLQQLPFREDSSNTDSTYLRNRIRHELLPLLKGYNPAISQRLTATASLLGEDEVLLSRYTDEAYHQLKQTGPGWTALPLHDLKQHIRPLRLRLYRASITAILGNQQGFELRHHQLLDTLLLNGTTGSRLSLPRGLAALLTSKHLLFANRKLLRPSPPFNCTITGAGRYELGNGLVLALDYDRPPASWQELPDATTYIDGDQAPFPWQVRPFLHGERLELLGMQGSRSIQDILTDLKFPQHLRSSLPLISCGETPLWLAGIRRTRHALVRSDQTDTIRIRLSGQEHLPLFP